MAQSFIKPEAPPANWESPAPPVNWDPPTPSVHGVPGTTGSACELDPLTLSVNWQCEASQKPTQSHATTQAPKRKRSYGGIRLHSRGACPLRQTCGAIEVVRIATCRIFCNFPASRQTFRRSGLNDGCRGHWCCPLCLAC